MKINIINEVITDPEKATDYIKEFMKSLGQEFETGFVQTNTRTIKFNEMSDEDALFVANQLQSMASEASKRRNTK